jgi:hypothetical protein
MSLHFAYGSNMSRALMAMRCPGAVALGTAKLPGWRFVITTECVGSIARHPGAVVRGVLWRLGPGDIAAINAYENLDAGLYVRRVLPVQKEGRNIPALVYIARRRGRGTPRPGYIHLVVEAAREWNLPGGYIRSLQRWSPSGWHGARTKDVGEFG